MNKKKLLLSMITIVMATVAYTAPHQVEVRNTQVSKEGDNLNVSFEIIPGKFPSNKRIHITPVIYNGEGNFARLEPIILVGKKRNKHDIRTGFTEGNRQVMSKKTSTVMYRTVLPYEDWMQYVAVALEQVVEDCCTQIEIPLKEVSEPKLLFYQVAPHYDPVPLRYELTDLEKYDIENPFLHPMEDYAKRYNILLNDRDKGTASVIFKVGSASLDVELEDNKNVLDAIAKAFDLIENDPNAILKNIMVTGYASPEGSLATNTRLAAQRAQAVKKFLQSRMKQPLDDIFEVHNGREDWDGLRDMVSKSDMDEKDEIIKIIDSYTMQQEQRKTVLQNLNRGVPYLYMLENFYPKLRTGGYVQVYYEIDRRATVATAITDEKGRTTWIDPDSPRNRTVTSINKGLELLVDHKFDEALENMLPYKDDPRAWNYIGVCYLMKGNYDEADKYFTKAAEQGNEDAKRNLEQTSWGRKIKNQ